MTKALAKILGKSNLILSTLMNSEKSHVLSQRLRIFSVISLQANLQENILTIQFDDGWYKEVKEVIKQDSMTVARFEGYTLDNDRLVRYNNQIYVPPNKKLRNLI
jgi:hypothetical protein